MENYLTISHLTTPQIELILDKKNIKFNNKSIFFDADDELKEIANYIKLNADYLSDIDINKIKFLYTTKPKKDGKRYVAGELILRKEIDKTINNEIDYFLIVYYQLWKQLDIENKVIQLDKILCGISINEDKIKKNPADTREYSKNIRNYGANKVLASSETVDMAVENIIDEEKEQKKILSEQLKKQQENE